MRADTRVAEDLDISRTKAAALLMSGSVRNELDMPLKPGQLIEPTTVLKYRDLNRKVSRAAGKLAPGLKQWGFNVNGYVVLDVGSSTGGFTQVLLEQGATKVFAVDVGHGQLAWRLRNDPRVVSMERTDIRDVTELPLVPDLVVMDVSFISLRRIIPHLSGLLPAGCPVIALFKPQFEVGKKVADVHRGIITDEAVIEKSLDDFRIFLRELRWDLREVVVSEVEGAKGNRERLLWLTAPASRYTGNDAESS